MKKILLFALPLLAMCFASCEKQQNEEWTDDSPIIEFTDPLFLKAIVGPYGVDMNNDGQISEKEASVITNL